MTGESATERTRQWIEGFVIGLGLCPFAREVFEAGQVRITESEADDPEVLLADLEREMRWLIGHPEIETSFLVHPRVLGDFLDYNDFLEDAEQRLRELGLEGVLQIASFHPAYRFAGAAADDPAHYSNRSPLPMLHLLREARVAEAVDGHPDPLSIPRRNVALLRELGESAIRQRLEGCGH